MTDPYDECECGHFREEHDGEGCHATATSGYRCDCAEFTPIEDD
jgi:hypothetical protein